MVHPTYLTFLAAQNSSPVQHQRKKNGHLSHIINPRHVEGRSGKVAPIQLRSRIII